MWIDDDLKAVNEFRRRESLRERCAEPIYNDLWIEVRQRIEEIKKAAGQESRFKTLTMDGNSYDRIVAMALPACSGSGGCKELHIKFVKNRPAIEASGTGVSVNLDYEVGDDDAVLLSHNRKSVTTEQAAQIVLQPFLFPELYQ